MNRSSSVTLWLFLAWVALVITDMWFDVVSTEVFLKISVTLGLVMVVAVCVKLSRSKHDD